ncbi:hypothetical protein [Streptomyces sp. NPDC050388]|uniref:hypothetical protein n=1 Tax=Streptomyces sp. NPDC050388 TaxID=3155781 RepID=UPI0034121FEB
MAAEMQNEEITRLLTNGVVRSVGRAADMGVVEFDGRGGEKLMAHLQCPFRITQDGKIVLGSRDMRHAQKGAGANAFDELRTVFDARAATLNGILEQLRPSVDGVSVGKAGELTVSWAPAFQLTAFPDCSGQVEAWRVFVRGGVHHVFPPGVD